MKKIGITGNIGSGKSTLARLFLQLGIPVYDADSRAKALMLENIQLKLDIIDAFGQEAYLPNGQLNRSFISSKAFTQPEKLKELNALVHPFVFKDFDDWVLVQHAPYVLKEAALLVESGSYKTLDVLIVVMADEEIRLKRCMARDQSDEAAVRARMRSQMPQEEKAQLAQFLIYNNEDLLIPQVVKIHRELIAN